MPGINTATSEQDHKVHHPLMLQPLIDPVIATFIKHFPNTLGNLLEQHGSPLNLVWPHAFEANAQALVNVLNLLWR